MAGDTKLCTAQDVIDLSGVTVQDLGVEDQAHLEDILETLIEGVSDQFRVYADKPTWLSDTVPYGVFSLVVRVSSNIVELAKQRRKTGVVQVSEFAIEMLQDVAYTSDIYKTLDLYRNKDVIDEDSRNKIGFGVSYLAEDAEE